MGKIKERLQTVRQHHAANRLRSSNEREFANDPDVVFHDDPPAPFDAPHGVNTPEEMMHSAVPVAD